MADVRAGRAVLGLPGIDRTLVLIDGQGIVLDVAGQSAPPDAVGPVLSFPGDVPTRPPARRPDPRLQRDDAPRQGLA